ncbi:MAG: sigma-70 family RNA polymerase sigma factor [Planctomycetaceae bacterium]|nr:sigma-70 family RNA polymerase sigma factor [Planctomycetaceae bacterium]
MSNADSTTTLALATSLSLLAGLRKSDDAAWSRFATLYGPVLYDFCRRQGLERTAAEDVVQEVMVSVSRSISRFRKERPGDSFRGWLYTIAQNKITDHHRKNGLQFQARGGTDPHMQLQQHAEEISGDSVVALPPLHLEIRRALELIRGHFDERTWHAFWGMTVDGRSAQEIAVELGMTEKAVRQAKYRVLKRFRDEFGDLLSP